MVRVSFEIFLNVVCNSCVGNKIEGLGARAGFSLKLEFSGFRDKCMNILNNIC